MTPTQIIMKAADLLKHGDKVTGIRSAKFARENQVGLTVSVRIRVMDLGDGSFANVYETIDGRSTDGKWSPVTEAKVLHLLLDCTEVM